MYEEVGEGTLLLVLAVALPCQTLSPCWGVHQHPPVLAPRAHPEPPSQAGPPLLLPDFDNILGLPGTATPLPCPPPAGPRAGEQHPRDPPCVPGAFGDAAGGISDPFQQRDRPRSLGAGYRKAWAPWVAPRGPRAGPWVAPGGCGASRLRFSGGGAGPARLCSAPDVRHRHKEGRGSSHLSGPCVPKSPHPHVPRSRCPCSLMATAPFVPKFSRSGVPVSRCLHFPGSLCPQVPSFPDPFVPSSRCPHVSAAIAGCCRQGRLPVPGEGSHGPAVGGGRGTQGWGWGEFWGVLPVLAGSRRCGALPVPTGGAAGGGAPASPGTDKGGGTGTGTGRDGPERSPPALLRRCLARCRRYRAPGGIRGVPGHTDLQHRGGCVLPGTTGGWVCGVPPPVPDIGRSVQVLRGTGEVWGGDHVLPRALHWGPGGTLGGSRVPAGAGVTGGAPPAPRECQAGQEHPAPPRRCCQTGWSWHGYPGTTLALPGQRAPWYSVSLWAPRFQPGLTSPSCTPRGASTHPSWHSGLNTTLANGGSWVRTAHPVSLAALGTPSHAGCWPCHGAFVSRVPLGPVWTCSSSCANRI